MAKRGVVPSSASEMLLPGTKWLPYRVSVPPEVTLLLPLSERLGARIVRPSPMIPAIMMRGMMITLIISVGAQP
jgi:hypothetical protein